MSTLQEGESLSDLVQSSLILTCQGSSTLETHGLTHIVQEKVSRSFMSSSETSHESSNLARIGTYLGIFNNHF